MGDPVQKLLRGIRSPSLVARKLNQLYYSRAWSRPHCPDGIDIIEADWDHLLILDACRYDMFREVVGSDARIEKRTSRGSATSEWLKANFDGRDLYDVVYLAGNPQFANHFDDLDVEFHATYDVWRTHWDDDLDTVPPEAMASVTRTAAAEFPQKRILAHFLQPHLPFLGPSARELPEPQQALWYHVMRGTEQVSDELLWRCFIENLELVLDEAIPLANELDGKAVISSDHGNMAGERVFPAAVKHYGHPTRLYHPKLVDVPWMVCESEPRRTVVPEPPERTDDDYDSAAVETRLEQLGYM